MISEGKDPEGYFNRLLSQAPADLPTPVLLGEDWLKENMPASPEASNKGTFGRAILFVGSDMYPGAALLAAKACLAGGCGILTVYSSEGVRPYFTGLPEAIFRIALSESSNEMLIGSADAVGIGCGWGSSPDKKIAERVMQSARKLLIDADGLNLLSRDAELFKMITNKCVLTPHPGEMSRLTGMKTEEIIADPARAAYSFAAEHNCTILLKGTCTVIAAPKKLVITAVGNNGLAKGGSGDALSGLITAMLCRGKPPFEAACIGSLLLGIGAQKAYEVLNTRLLRASNVTDAIMKGIL